MHITRILGLALKRLTFIIFSGSVVLFILINLLALAEPSKLQAPSQQTVVIADVNLVDVRGSGKVISNQMVIVDGNVITYVGDNASNAHPAGATVIQATGQFLMAGLIDSHIHTLRLSPQLHFPLMIANGVTSARDMGDSCSWSAEMDCEPDVEQWRKQRVTGEIVAPRILQSVSFHLEDDYVDERALAARITLLKKRAEPFLKLQLNEQIPQSEFATIIKLAESQGIAVAGHIPFSADLRLLTHPMTSIEHDVSLLAQCSDARYEFTGRNSTKQALLKGINGARCKELLQQLAKQQTLFVPTHIAATGQDLNFAKATFTEADQQLMQNYLVAPQRWLWQLMQNAGLEAAAEQAILADFHQAALALTKQAHDSGVIVLAGTDALDAGVMHGFSLHKELQYLVRAGLSPAEAIYSATIAPAQAFGLAAELGSIESGKLADLVLLAANPLQDISNTEKITLVVADGRIYQQEERDNALSYVRTQAHTITVIARFIRGLWY